MRFRLSEKDSAVCPGAGAVFRVRSGWRLSFFSYELRVPEASGFLASGSLKFDYPVLPRIDGSGCYPAATTTGAAYLNDSLSSGTETGG